MANDTDGSHPSSSGKQPSDEKDRFGDELGDDAQIWRDHEKITTEEDDKLVQQWNNGLNDLALFAALFSAVTTAFIIESQQDMKEDYAKLSFLALSAIASGKAFDPEPFVVPGSARIINCLWIASLLLSLAAAFIAIMGKDWISMYRLRPVCTPRQWAEIRTYRLRYVEKWRMSGVIGSAPVLLHLSLILFGAGLVLFISDDPITHRLTLGVSVAAGALYIATGLTAVIFAPSPFKSPESQSVRELFAFVYRLFSPRDEQMPLDEQTPPPSGAQHTPSIAAGQSPLSAGAQQTPPGAAGHTPPHGGAHQTSQGAHVAARTTLRNFADVFVPTFKKLTDVFSSTAGTEVQDRPAPHLLAEALSRLRAASSHPKTLESIVIALGDINCAPELAGHISPALKKQMEVLIAREWQRRDLHTLSRYILASYNVGLELVNAVRDQVLPTFEEVLADPSRTSEAVLVAHFLISNGFENVAPNLVRAMCPRGSTIDPRTMEFLLKRLETPRSDTNCGMVIVLVNSCWSSLDDGTSKLLNALKHHLQDSLDDRLPLAYSLSRPESAVDFLSFVLSLDEPEIFAHPTVRKAAADLLRTLIAPEPRDGEHPCLVLSFGSANYSQPTSVWHDRQWSASDLLSIRWSLPLLQYGIKFKWDPSEAPPASNDGRGFVECLVRTVVGLLFPRRPWSNSSRAIYQGTPPLGDLELCVRCVHAHLCHPLSVLEDAPKASIICDILKHAVLFRAKDVEDYCFWGILGAIALHILALLESTNPDPQREQKEKQEQVRLLDFFLRREWEEKDSDGKVAIRAWDLLDHLRESAARQIGQKMIDGERKQLEGCVSALERLCKALDSEELRTSIPDAHRKTWKAVQVILGPWPLPT